MHRCERLIALVKNASSIVTKQEFIARARPGMH
jgi:hypothetical protein